MKERTRRAEHERASELAVRLRATLRRMRMRLREYGGGYELTPSQVSVLLRLEKDGAATVSSLARAEAMKPQSMSAIVASLEEAGLVSGAPDANDGRKTLMSLTKSCRKRMEEARAAKQDWLTATILEKLSVGERETLAKAVELCDRLVAD